MTCHSHVIWYNNWQTTHNMRRASRHLGKLSLLTQTRLASTVIACEVFVRTRPGVAPVTSGCPGVSAAVLTEELSQGPGEWDCGQRHGSDQRRDGDAAGKEGLRITEPGSYQKTAIWIWKVIRLLPYLTRHLCPTATTSTTSCILAGMRLVLLSCP